MPRPIRLGVITSEFFDIRLGPMGGFGWAAKQLGQIFREDPSLGVELIYVAGFAQKTRETQVHGSRLVQREKTRWANLRKIRRERLDLLLTIDYNSAYTVYLRSLPRTPAIVWVRDPRTPDDVRKIQSLRIPGEDAQPQGILCADGGSLARISAESAWLGRPLLFATPEPRLVTRLKAAYGVEPWNFYRLPNSIQRGPPRIVKSDRPTVVFLGRLDPIKRPWIFAELARHFPRVEFLFLGQSHFSGPGAWCPAGLSPNIRLLGHVGEADKSRLLSAAWVVLNTSIHEGLAISFLEALACEAPLLSCQDPGFVVSRYGIYTGRFDGSGMEALDAFTQSLETMLDDHDLRRHLGRSGRAWVESTHTREGFVEAFRRLCEHAGLGR